MFNSSQSSFEELKKIVAEGTAPIFLWIGAGLSRPAGFPSWDDLKSQLLKKARSFVEQQVCEEDQGRKEALLRVAETDNDEWSAFDRIYEVFGEAEYSSAMLSVFQSAVSCKIPYAYKALLQISSIKGIVTTNIDRLATRSLIEDCTITPSEFCGCDCRDYLYLLSGNRKFVLNLHGVFEKRSSWVMRRKELEKLQNDMGYRNFLASLFTEKVVVFVGVNPTDESVRVHLDRVRDKVSIPGSTPIYWITERRDRVAEEFCARYNIRRIVYSGLENHKELDEIVQLLNDGKSLEDDDPAPRYLNVTTAEKSVRNFEDINFENLSSAELRNVLNKRAIKILARGTKEAYDEYACFLEKYKRQIHSAWFVVEGENVLGLTIEKKIGEGAFGRVFKAHDDKGNVIAVKILKEDVMWQPEWLQSFRRGVKAMEILAKNSIDGIVRYNSASEIPALVSMEWIDGPDLYEVVQQKQFTTWREKLDVLCKIGKIVRSAHALPERVLHRDLRPQNIMLRGFYDGDDWDACVLDFDLAYHKGANEVSMQVGFGNGFSAPEQTKMGVGGSRRSSRVDSYGYAMLCYYVITGEMPLPAQCFMRGWSEQVDSKIRSRPCGEWQSLPHKMALLIKQCTAVDQNKRLDLYQMHDIVLSLYSALKGEGDKMSPQAILDELACRVAIGKKRQGALEMSSDGCVKFESFGGALYMFWIEEPSVCMEVSWHNKGNFDFGVVKKTLGDKANCLVGKLRALDFIKCDYHFEGMGVRIRVSFSGRDITRAQLFQLAGIMIKIGIEPRTF